MAERGAAHVVATDVTNAAVENATFNASSWSNVEVRRGDLFDPVATGERFDIIFWNAPFIPVSADFQTENPLEWSLVDPGYDLTRRYLEGAPRHLVEGGRILLGWGGDGFADTSTMLDIAKEVGLLASLCGERYADEGQTVKFTLWELVRGN